MNLAALSMGLSQMTLKQQAGLSVEKMAMNASKEQSTQFINSMMKSTPTPHPSLGHQIDLKA